MNLLDYFNRLAPARERWLARNRYYHDQLARALRFFVPPDTAVLEVGCGLGQLLASLQPRRGVGIDLSPEMVARARDRHPHLEFRVDDIEDLKLDEPFDYLIVSDLLGFLHDVQQSFTNLHAACHPRTRVIVSYYNYLWEPVLRLGERLGIKARQPLQNWLGTADIENLLDLAGFEVVRRTTRLLLPKYIPLLSAFCNRVLVHLPVLRHFALVQVVIARPKPGRLTTETQRHGEQEAANANSNSRSLRASAPSVVDPSVSVIVPARHERGNIEAAVRRTPAMGSHTEIIFVEGNSTDGTTDEIRRVIAGYPDRDLRLIPQGTGRGKADAVRKGFAAATGDILMILDADLTVDPEELPKFYDALVSGHGEFLHGTRLVYPMADQAMRFLNVLANKFFSQAFTWLLDQRFKDTLCGTKVLRRTDYERIAAGRAYFGEFDPFGDFDLIFGAAKLNLKIVEIPIHYRERTYGATNISRFRHGCLLLRMCLFALRKIKFV
ncbi:glycosyltransferase [bacterium]|nr:glycosyltransferase [bacterium]